MTTHPRRSAHLLALALLVAFAGPALAEAPDPASSTEPAAVEPADAPEAAPAGTPEAVPGDTPVQPALDSALEQSHDPQLGDCVLWCSGEQFRYSWVTRGECCGGTLTCPDGSQAAGYAFYPYQGVAEFCST